MSLSYKLETKKNIRKNKEIRDKEKVRVEGACHGRNPVLNDELRARKKFVTTYIYMNTGLADQSMTSCPRKSGPFEGSGSA